MSKSINTQEIEHFAKDSSHWWDESGPFAPLHKLNPVRLSYICQQIRQHYGLNEKNDGQLNSLNILDIGCGGGLVCEPLARLGASVSGVDADKNAIHVASEHAQMNDLSINYQCGSAEDISKQYDVVLALEIIEHVDNVDHFVHKCVELTKPNGLIILSTLNRTLKSMALGIITAEYILNWVPKGTHQWKKFIKPSELAKYLRDSGALVNDVSGLHYSPFAKEFCIDDKGLGVNYLITAEKK